MADCVPILAADARHGVIGVAHAGRVGAAAGIASRLVETMCSVGALPADLSVRIGPSICGRCYEVPPAMQAVAAGICPAVPVRPCGTTVAYEPNQ